MPGSIVKTMLSSSTSFDVRPTRGASCTEANAVAEAVAKGLAVAGGLDHVVCDHVALLAGHARLHHLLGGELCREHDVVNLLELIVGLAEEDRSVRRSDMYPPTSEPMSITTPSPASSFRSRG